MESGLLQLPMGQVNIDHQIRRIFKQLLSFAYGMLQYPVPQHRKRPVILQPKQEVRRRDIPVLLTFPAQEGFAPYDLSVFHAYRRLIMKREILTARFHVTADGVNQLQRSLVTVGVIILKHNGRPVLFRLRLITRITRTGQNGMNIYINFIRPYNPGAQMHAHAGIINAKCPGRIILLFTVDTADLIHRHLFGAEKEHRALSAEQLAPVAGKTF